MKALKLLSVVAVAAILISSCKKDDAEKTSTEKIQAKWNFQKDIYHENYSGVDYKDTSYAAPGDYSDFRTDGRVYSKFGGDFDTASYSLLGDNRVIMSYTGSPFQYNDTFTIQVLTDNQLQLHSKYFDPAPDYYEDTYYFAK